MNSAIGRMEGIPKEWWRDFRSHYFPYLGSLKDNRPILTQQDTEQFVEFVRTNLDLRAGAKILDLCCGPGAYAIELTKQGFDVVGIDLSKQFIHFARRTAKELRENQDVKFLICDIRDIPFVKHFDAVINIGTSFGLFDDDADNCRVLECIAKSLKLNGIFLLQTNNRDWYLKNFVAKDWYKHDDGRITIIQREFDYVRSRMMATFETVGDGTKESWFYSWRAYTLAEIIAMLKQVGFTASRVFGDWKSGEYSVDAKRMVVVSKKWQD